MARRAVRWILVVLVLGTGACEREEPGEPGELDTLDIEIPVGEVEDRLERGARRIGGRVGEALEGTGEAIERAGERIQDEAGKRDSLAP